MTTEERIDELFGHPPAEFTRARDALATELRAAGARDSAARVRALRRPTVAAWALNQLARRDPGGLERLRAVGDELAALQRQALSGFDPAALRAGQERRRAVTAALLATALEALREAGVAAEPHADVIRGGLDAAAADPEQADALAAGRLQRPPAPPSGFGPLAAVPPRPEQDGAKPGAGAVETRAAAQERAVQAARRADAARREADRLQQEAERATRDAERAAARVADLEQELAGARAARAGAGTRARDATEAAAQAARAATRAERERSQAEAERDAAGP